MILKFLDRSTLEAVRCDIIDNHLEVEVEGKTAEELKTIFTNSSNLGHIDLTMSEDEDNYGYVENWTKFGGVLLTETSCTAIMSQPVDVTEQRIASLELASAKATSDATTALNTANSIASTAEQAKSDAETAKEGIESVKADVSNTASISSAAFIVAKAQSQTLSDQDALQAKMLYHEWSYLCETSYKAENAGFKFTHKDQLYKTAQDSFTFQSQWEPGSVGTESIYTLIDEDHAGTKEDPIPYKKNMEIFNGKYYTQNDVLYQCIRDSGIPMQYDLADLISGGYVKIIE